VGVGARWIARISSSHVWIGHFEAIQMGLVPEDQLPPLSPEVDVLGLPPRARRILRLAAPTPGERRKKTLSNRSSC